MGLIGWPVEHSISPAMHNAAYQEMGIGWHYQLIPTPAERLESTLARLEEEGFRGVNVTVPHKQAVVPYLDKVAGEALGIGAVNTIVRQPDGRLIGSNTDGSGFVWSIRDSGYDPAGLDVVVLGAGGAARAVSVELALAGAARVTIANRTASKRDDLESDVCHRILTNW